MKRRQFIKMAVSAAAWPTVARAQQSRIPVIGFLHGASPDGFTDSVAAFRQGLSERGLDEGRNLAIEYRWLEGRYERSSEAVAEFVRRPVDLIFAGGSPAPIRAAKAATKTIPIVFTVGRDPVRLGLVDSLNQPGGNLTGAYLFVANMESKRLGLLREMVPQASLIAVLFNPNTENLDGQSKDVQEAARVLGQPLTIVRAATEQEIETAFGTAARAGAKAMLLASDVFLDGQHKTIVAAAARYRLPTIYSQREHAIAGGLMSYGTKRNDAYRQTGIYVARILKGEKPADLPVVQSTQFEFVLNLKTAKVLGLDISPTLLARADEAIE